MNPTFTRRHYQKIAEVINDSWTPTQPSIIKRFVLMFKEDNPKFDENRFLRACTIIDFKEEK